jgi:peptidoglycan/LPS O-acetylase OafA/YrhL
MSDAPTSPLAASPPAPALAGHQGPADATDRLRPLDGWRGISILAVMAAHMLPVGPKEWQGNGAAGTLGMCLFFTLSGFLITSMLLRHMGLRAFFIRRGCRILPLALAYATIVLAIQGLGLAGGLFFPEGGDHGRIGPATFLAHYLFLVNYWSLQFTHMTGHLWSLCVEIHFYLFIGLLCLVLRRAAFWCLPVACLAITALRVATHTPLSIVTHVRVDEILSGACLALVYSHFLGNGPRRLLSWRPLQPALALLLLASCHPSTGPLNYARPYFAAGLVGSTLFQANLLQRLLLNRALTYIATISYALYIFHPITYQGWMGTGGTAVKYGKRVIAIAVAFGLAHLSTFYYEKYWIALGKKWSTPRKKPRPAAAEPLQVSLAASAPPATPALAAAGPAAPPDAAVRRPAPTRP